MHLHKVHLIAVTNPVRKNHVDCNQVLEVHSQNGDFETLALVEGLSVTGVVVVGRDQLCHLTPDLDQQTFVWLLWLLRHSVVGLITQ